MNRGKIAYKKANRKDKKINWKSFVDDAWEYIKESKNYIYLVVGLFILFAILGFAFRGILSSLIDPYLKDLINQTKDMSGIRLILFIFYNNSMVAFYGILLGIALGIFPVINAVLNGAVLGYVFSKVYQVSGFTEFWRILPHGIFELPAIFISLGLGIKLGMFVFNKEPFKVLKYRLLNSLKVFFFIILPLLIVAAIIEGLLISFLR